MFQRRENVVVASVFCGYVLCLFLPVWVRGFWYRLTLVQDSKISMPAEHGSTQTERRGCILGLLG